MDDVGTQVPSLVDEIRNRVRRLSAVLVSLSGNVLRARVLPETGEALGVIERGYGREGRVSSLVGMG